MKDSYFIQCDYNENPTLKSRQQLSLMTCPQGGMMFGAKSSSNTTLQHHTILTVQGRGTGQTWLSPKPILTSKEEAQAMPGSPLLNHTYQHTPSEVHLHAIHCVQSKQ